MFKSKIIWIYFLCFLNCLPGQSLKVVTVNIWSGLDYEGIFKVGEYETSEQREKRFQFLIQQLRKIDADIIFLQEANPVKTHSAGIAKKIGMEEVHIVCNPGIKIASLGLPENLQEGITILAKPKFNLIEMDIWKLSGSFGIYGDYISFQLDESNFALVAKITIDGLPLYLINVHTNSAPPKQPALVQHLQELYTKNIIAQEEFNDGLNKWNNKLDKRRVEYEMLNEKLKELPEGTPYILGGDFNTEPEDHFIQNLIEENKLIDTYCSASSALFTWMPSRNVNIRYSTEPSDSEENTDAYQTVYRYYDNTPRRIDYLFLNHLFDKSDVKGYKLVLDSIDGNTQVSDHFGVFSEIEISKLPDKVKRESEYFQDINSSSIEPFPILMYDTDIGFGYGAKAFFLNLFNQNESFDLTAFNSTKGERWYRFALSWPDIEKRQGKIYPLAIDFAIDYDKMIKNGFYGIGKNSKYSDQEFYTKEPLEICLSASRGFTTKFVSQFGLRAKKESYYNFENSGKLKDLIQAKSDSNTVFLSAFLNLRYDSRNSFINPSSGVVIQGEYELLYRSNDKNHSSLISKYQLGYQSYSVLFYPTTILAVRLQLQNIAGNNLPLQVLHSLGGNKTLRGYAQDRLMDKCSILFNGELRFPIYKRFTGILGIDAGQVFPSISDVGLSNWKINPVTGLRFIMENFVVRLDAGFSSETTGLYFNFGHIF